MNADKKIIQVGIIGCGAIAVSKHLPSLKKNENFHVRAFCNRSLPAAEEARKQFGDAQCYAVSEYADVLNDPRIDAVCICLPNHLHAPVSIASMEAGKHVLCEKPMSCCFSDSKAMYQTSLNCRKVLSIGYQNRWTDSASYLRSLCQDGYLGEIYHIDAEYMRSRAIPTWGAFTANIQQGGGALLDIGSHVIDLALWVSGNYHPVEVLGCTYHHIAKSGSECNRWGKWDPEAFDLEDSAFGVVLMRNQLTLHIRTSWAANCLPGPKYKLTLLGTKAGAVLTPDGLSLVAEINGKMLQSVVRPSESAFGRYTPSPSHATPADCEWRCFYNAIKTGDPKSGNSGQALVVSHIVDALYKSSQQKQSVRLQL